MRLASLRGAQGDFEQKTDPLHQRHKAICLVDIENDEEGRRGEVSTSRSQQNPKEGASGRRAAVIGHQNTSGEMEAHGLRYSVK